MLEPFKRSQRTAPAWLTDQLQDEALKEEPLSRCLTNVEARQAIAGLGPRSHQAHIGTCPPCYMVGLVGLDC